MDTFARPSSPADRPGGPVGGKVARNTLKKQVWDMHLGPGVLRARCPLCGITEIHQNQNNSSDLCHIIARKYYGDELNVFYLMPGCKSCNSQCEDATIFDFLWARNRLAMLRKTIMVITQTFIEMHEHELATEERMAWRILEHLYGPSRFSLAGGIQNTKAIYEIARVEQHAALVKESAALAARQQELITQMRAVMESDIKPMKFSGF